MRLTPKPGTSRRSARSRPESGPTFSVTASENPPKVLLVSSDPEDHRALRHILQGAQWQILAVKTYAGAITQLSTDHVPIIICEAQLKGGTWQEILNHTSQGRERSLLIVTSRLADDYLWAEVLNLGGYDVLSKPFSEREVQHVVASAWLSISGQVRTHAAGA